MLCASSVSQVSIFVLYIDGCANYIASLYRIGVGALHHQGPQGDLRQPAQGKHQAEPRQVRLRGPFRQTPRVPGVSSRHRSKPRQDQGHRADAAPSSPQGHAKLSGMYGQPRPVHLQVRREGAAIFQDHEEVWSLQVRSEERRVGKECRL